jgi:hypothetical protein
MTNLLRSPDPAVRGVVLQALAAIHPAAEPAIPAVEAIVEQGQQISGTLALSRTGGLDYIGIGLEPRFLLGDLYMAAGRHAEATKEYQALGESGFVGAFERLGHYYRRAGDPASAAAAFRQFAEPSSPFPSWVGSWSAQQLNSLAWSYVSMGIHRDAAVELAERAVRMNPADFNIRDTLGWAYLANEQYLESLEAFESVLRDAPSFQSSWTGLGWLAETSVDPDRLLAVCQRICQGPRPPEAAPRRLAAIRAQIAERTGDKSAAQRWWREAGWITDDRWWVLGPFATGWFKPIRRPFMPEDRAKIDRLARYPGHLVHVRWTPARDTARDGFIDFAELFGGDTARHCAYAWTQWSVGQPMQAELLLISGDTVKVWLNGRPIGVLLEAKDDGSWSGRTRVTLVAGTNTLLVKVANHIGGWTGGWGFQLAITEPGGSPLPGLRWPPLDTEGREEAASQQ